MPAYYRLVDKVNKWGAETKDPLAVRQLTEDDRKEDIIMTTNVKAEKQAKRDRAIAQIELSFQAAQKFKKGMLKGDGSSGVFAVNQFPFLPMIKLLLSKTAVVVGDDIIEDQLYGKAPSNNDFLLYQMKDDQDKEEVGSK